MIGMFRYFMTTVLVIFFSPWNLAAQQLNNNALDVESQKANEGLTSLIAQNTGDRTNERTNLRTSEAASERNNANANEKNSELAKELARQRANERSSDQTIEQATQQGLRRKRNRNSKVSNGSSQFNGSSASSNSGDSSSSFSGSGSSNSSGGGSGSGSGNRSNAFSSADDFALGDKSEGSVNSAKIAARSGDEAELPRDEISEMSVNDPTLKALEYPELQVQPSASQRVQLEIQSENSKRWLYYWPIQLSALSLLVAESKASGHHPPGAENTSKLDDAVKIAQYTAGGWLVGTIALSGFYRPYREGAKRTRFKPQDKKQLLSKERLSEEALEDSAMLTQKLNWISVATNLGASINLAAAAHPDDRPYAVFSAVLALTPLFFKSSTVTVWERHQNYKKRIYGPLSSIRSTLVRDPYNMKIYPGVGLSMVF